jgi:lipid-A-disaccharide synthase
MLESAKLLLERYPDLQFILPLASSVDRETVNSKVLQSGLHVSIIEGKNYDVMQTCDAIIAASGTVTMEIALFGVPMVIIYKASPLTFAVGKRLLNVDHVGICNIIAQERVVPELIQNDAEPKRIAAEISRFLDNPDYYSSVVAKLLLVREKLGEPGAPARVAKIAFKMMFQRNNGTF